MTEISVEQLTEAEKKIEEIVLKLPLKDAVYLLESIKHFMLMRAITNGLQSQG